MPNLPNSNPNRKQQLPVFLLPALLEVFHLPSASLCAIRALEDQQQKHWLLVWNTLSPLDFRCWAALDGEVISYFLKSYTK